MNAPRAGSSIDTRTEPGARIHQAVMIVTGLAIIMLVVVAAALWQLRRDAMSSEERILSTLASALADEMERGLRGVSAVLQNIRDDLRTGRLSPGQPELAERLQVQAGILPLVSKLWLLDEHGRVVAASTALPGEPSSAFLPRLSNLLENAVALSAPYADSARGEPAIALAMRTADTKGQINGLVMAEVPARLLEGAFPRVDLGASARMEVWRTDGVKLAGFFGVGYKSPDPAAVVSTVRPSGSLLSAFETGGERFTQQRVLEHFPVRLVLTRDTRHALGHWEEVARFAGVVLAIILFVLAALLTRTVRAERAREVSQRALLAERERAALAFAAAQEGNWDWTPGSTEVYLSPRMKEMMGLPRDAGFASLPLERWFSAMHPEDAEQLRTLFLAQTTSPAPRIDVQLRVRQRDERWHWLRLRGTASHDAQGRTLHVAGVGFDVTDERERAARTQRLEAQLARTRKLESLGTLAGGVAHDFNNILAAVVGYSEMARQAAPEGSPQARYLDQVLQAGLRGKAEVARILTFSRSSSRQHSAFVAQPVVDQVLEMLAAGMGRRIVLTRRIDQEALCIWGDATQFFEATLNLCTNALLSMHGQGELSVSLRGHRSETERWLSHGRLLAGDYVELSVADTGEGIPSEVMEHLFEPFFTTRAAGSGTGLGLAVVHGVVEDFGGAIDVSSAPGKGSTFTLYLPRAEGELTEAQEAPAIVLSGQGQSVLVVDDEQTLMTLTEESLAQLGYEPIGFTRAEAALTAFRASPSRFDLVLTDEVMPSMSGIQLASQIHEIRPDIPILLLSGYGGPQLVQRAHAAGVSRVLTKPLQRDELARSLAEALHSA